MKGRWFQDFFSSWRRQGPVAALPLFHPLLTPAVSALSRRLVGHPNTWVLATPTKSNHLEGEAQVSIFHKQTEDNQDLGLGIRVPVPQPLGGGLRCLLLEGIVTSNHFLEHTKPHLQLQQATQP